MGIQIGDNNNIKNSTISEKIETNKEDSLLEVCESIIRMS